MGKFEYKFDKKVGKENRIEKENKYIIKNINII